jgi:opacity protein-like surface antigen
MKTFLKYAVTCATLLTASTAFADDAPATGTSATPAQNRVPADTEGTPNKNAPPSEPGQPLPEATSDHDEQPVVASPTLPSGGLVSQAGVGGVVGYGRAGVLELGGSGGFQFATDYRAMNVSPTVGWFLADNLEISAILSAANIKAGDQSTTVWSGLAEPSYHVPFNRSVFAFLGLGIGASYVSELGTGLALAPRLGMNILVGRSAVLTPSISYQYTSSDAMTTDNITVVAVSSSTRFNVGYTAMW